MAKYTESQKRAALKYQSKTVTIQIRVPEEKRKEFKEKAAAKGMSLTQFVIMAMEECK